MRQSTINDPGLTKGYTMVTMGLVWTRGEEMQAIVSVWRVG